MVRENAFLDTVCHDNREAIQRLLEEEPDLVNARTPDGVSAVRLAVYHGHPDTAAWLRSRGATPHMFDAAALGVGQRIGQLVEGGGDANALVGDGWTPLHLAAFFNHSELARGRLAAGADPCRVAPAVAEMLLAGGAYPNAREPGGLMPLQLAAIEGTPQTVRLLLNSGADASLCNAEGRLPVDHARECGEDDITRAFGS
ncbi:ankyrin repeat domain-containing protein [Sinorhizobium meliloti]|uniref:ankyrin repeat domain-containing protein n=1 Tax=Rhizobium meliloti TaxID=382 RepID=UPI000FD84B28|nr:ankyrin repeat domain-containing protein [Sinorhizobium meliloti]RVK17011.1 ankyrin repeat domain-containing protein [Sinorhizobium meliloti]